MGLYKETKKKAKPGLFGTEADFSRFVKCLGHCKSPYSIDMSVRSHFDAESHRPHVHVQLRMGKEGEANYFFSLLRTHVLATCSKVYIFVVDTS